MRRDGWPDKLRVAAKGKDFHVLWPGDLATPYTRAGYEVRDYPAVALPSKAEAPDA